MSTQTYIDGVETTDVVLEGSLTRRLNRPAQATIRTPIQYAIGQPGSRLRIYTEGVLAFHGQILTVSDDAGEDAGYTEYVAQDPMELWKWRPARDGDGDFSDPDFFRNYKFGPQIMEEILHNSEDDCGRPIGEYECDGDLFLEYGGFATGGIDLSGAPTNFPMTIAEVATTLTSTGELDIVLTPIDYGSNMAVVSCYNGNYGDHLENVVHFQYALGDYNVRELRQVFDMSNLVNKLWYYLGPKEDVQHWFKSINGVAVLAPHWQNSGFYGAFLRAITEQDVSRFVYGTRMEIQVHDSRGDEGTIGVHLQRKLWVIESLLRAWPRHLVHITPIRGFDVNAFGIGDIVRVSAGGFVRGTGKQNGAPMDEWGSLFPGGWTGSQRIYEYTVSWDTDGVTQISEIITSPTDDDF